MKKQPVTTEKIKEYIISKTIYTLAQFNGKNTDLANAYLLGRLDAYTEILKDKFPKK